MCDSHNHLESGRPHLTKSTLWMMMPPSTQGLAEKHNFTTTTPPTAKQTMTDITKNFVHAASVLSLCALMMMPVSCVAAELTRHGQEAAQQQRLRGPPPTTTPGVRIFGVGLTGSGCLALRDALSFLELKLEGDILLEDGAFAPFMYDDGRFNMSGTILSAVCYCMTLTEMISC